MEIKFAKTVEEAKEALAAGFCPIECSFGSAGSVVDYLFMDHHGLFSDMESVAIRAYRDHYGARKDDQRFVVTGAADADATIAILALAGILPHPTKDVTGLTPLLHPTYKQDLSELVELVARIDTDPIGVDLSIVPWGPELLLFNALTNGPQEQATFVAACFIWQRLLFTGPAMKALVQATTAEEANRRGLAQDAVQIVNGPVRTVSGSQVWGFDVWYDRNHEGAPETAAGWLTPIVVAITPVQGNITIGCPNQAVAEELFGAGGLKNAFAALDAIAPGWGGRESIGGSPRGVKLTHADAVRAGEILAQLIVK